MERPRELDPVQRRLNAQHEVRIGKAELGHAVGALGYVAFLVRHALIGGLQRPGVPLERLVAYPWPGNVRELENVIERAMILVEGERITARALPESVVSPPAHGPAGDLDAPVVEKPRASPGSTTGPSVEAMARPSREPSIVPPVIGIRLSSSGIRSRAGNRSGIGGGSITTQPGAGSPS